MDENEYICPLCIEELDISDRQFFPCKCGYQVCMWCWHRIRESESGLCPACRTPYGDDPHEFSAVDVEEVLKANKEKEAAAKRERDRLRHELSYSHGGSASNSHNHSLTGSSLDDNHSHMSGGPGGGLGSMDVPKDRSQLANMRVIRRNLVYAVGLPPSIAQEETLRKCDYFGQYGKISKIVLNRSQASTSGGDIRRSSCSAYVTLTHKEDTLACILALDGFYLESRNIRASYGTSKYCSAFIKNVRCNNPECTYLHEMGAGEDTFTKQEIQAGYVTSGRDVLARQQQIASQVLATAPARKKIGGGGPSGTGKACPNPVLPAPEYDEPIKHTPIPQPSSISRSSTSTATGFSSAASANLLSTKLARSASVGNKPTPNMSSLLSGNRKGILGAQGIANSAAPIVSHGTTAASVVAGVHNVTSTSEPPASHTTLTALTPLKRSTKAAVVNSKTSSSLVGSVAGGFSDASAATADAPVPKGLTPTERALLIEQRRESMAAVARQQSEMAHKLVALRNNGVATKKANGRRGVSGIASNQSTAPVSPSSAATSAGTSTKSRAVSSANQTENSVGSLGGEVISSLGRSKQVSNIGAIGSSVITFGGGNSGTTVGSSALLDTKDMLGAGSSIGGLDSLGGEIFTGQLNPGGGKSAIGSGKDKWNASGPMLAPRTSTFDGVNRGRGGLWINENGGSSRAVGNPNVGIGGNNSSGIIGSHVTNPGLSENHFGVPGGRQCGSSALASILRINLPTGSGSLRETSSTLWNTGNQPGSSAGVGPAQQPISSLSSLNVGELAPSQGVIGQSGKHNHDSLIGGVPIVGVNPPGAFGSSNKNDIALLQSLLPGVHITSGSESSMGFGGWGSAQGVPGHHRPNNAGGGSGNNNGTWGSNLRPSGGPAVGAVGQNNSHQQRGQGAGNIW